MVPLAEPKPARAPVLRPVQVSRIVPVLEHWRLEPLVLSLLVYATYFFYPLTENSVATRLGWAGSSPERTVKCKL
jgi:hypothetical protein